MKSAEQIKLYKIKKVWKALRDMNISLVVFWCFLSIIFFWKVFGFALGYKSLQLEIFYQITVHEDHYPCRPCCSVCFMMGLCTNWTPVEVEREQTQVVIYHISCGM